MVGSFCSVWQNDRTNLKKHIELFNGHLSRRISNIKDVSNFISNFIERLERNKCSFSKNDFIQINDILNTSFIFDKKLFVRGYQYSQYKFIDKKVSE